MNQTRAEHTDGLLAASFADNPNRRRQCAIGFHGECSDPDGTEGYACAGYPLLAALVVDHPQIGVLANLYRTWTWLGANHYHGWIVGSYIIDAGFTFDKDAPVAETTSEHAERLVNLMWGEPVAVEDRPYAAGLLEDLKERGLLRRRH